MIDLHTHSLLSDGALLPSELVRRAHVAGYKTIAITDHVDMSNIEYVVPAIVNVAKRLNIHWKIHVIPGVELTHIPLEEFKPLTRFARRKGARLIVAHGETTVEPVLPGTNKAAIEAGIDILAHPGEILPELARLAAKRGVFLEITSRRGHCLTNGIVAKVGLNAGARLLLNSDAHLPEDLITKDLARAVLIGAGLTDNEAQKVFNNAERFK